MSFLRTQKESEIIEWRMFFSFFSAHIMCLRFIFITGQGHPFSSDSGPHKRQKLDNYMGHVL